MARFKDFGGKEGSDKEPLSFKLHGEEFHCLPEVQGKILLDLVAESGKEDDPAAGALIINKFFSSVLVDESYTRFNALLESKDKIVPMEMLAEVTSWLVQEYADRPTEGPEVS